MTINEEVLNALFADARTHRAWLDRDVPNTTLHQLYEHLKWGPTAINCNPLRLKFVVSPPERQKLLTCLAPGNVEKTRSAPVTAIVGMDMRFFTQMPHLFPHNPAAGEPFAIDEALSAQTAFRNSSMQGGYMILAARALGLDVGPMSGFDEDKVNLTFFAGTTIRANFLCNLGYGDPAVLQSRLPRLPFDLACEIV